MQRRILKWLHDIRDSAVFIRTAIAGKTLDDYKKDGILRAAVERHFEIIGEAMNRISRVDPDIQSRVPDASRIVAFRNLLIHGYDVIEHATVWQVATTSLPLLEQQIGALIEGDDSRH